MTSAQIGLAGSVFFLAFTVGSLLAGLLKKRKTFKWSLLALAIIWAASMLPKARQAR